MGHGFKAYMDAVLILTGIKGKKAMADKADEVRQLLIDGATTPRIVLAIMQRCKKENPQTWIRASIAQVAAVKDIPVVYARALVSEYSGVQTTI